MWESLRQDIGFDFLNSELIGDSRPVAIIVELMQHSLAWRCRRELGQFFGQIPNVEDAILVFQWDAEHVTQH